MSALLSFPSHLADALPSVSETGTSLPAFRLVRRKWHYRYESFSEYLQWIYDANRNSLPYELTDKFEFAIIVTREHESTINVLEGNNQDPDTRFVISGYPRAFRTLMHFLKDQVLDGVALDRNFNLRVACECSARLELARDGRIGGNRRDRGQGRDGRQSRYG